MYVLRNRLIMLHHFSDLFCKSLTLFGMQPKATESSGTHEGAFEGFDQLRSLLVSSSKVGSIEPFTIAMHTFLYLIISAHTNFFY